MATLYVVATPIGNLEDITLRALRALREVSLIAAEDTRKTRRLLAKYDIKTPSTSYHEHNKLAKLEYLLNFLAEKDVALVSDAGTPGMSDTGYELIRGAVGRGIPVVSIPGPAIIVTALVVSGLPTDRVLSLGFLPHKVNDRQRLLKSVANEPGTIVILEAPHRLLESLEDIRQVLGDRRVAVCREMTKVHEEIFRGRINQAIAHFTEPRGEFTLIIEGKGREAKPQLTDDIKQELARLRRAGSTAREAIARVAEDTGLTRKELYRAWLELS